MTDQPGDVLTPVRPPLHRPGAGRQVAGVCAGLAAHLRVNVSAVRVAFVGLALLGGAGVVVYGFLWALAPQAESASQSGPQRVDPVLLVVLAGMAVVALGVGVAAQFGGQNLRIDIWGPLMVVALGAAFAWFQLDGATGRASHGDRYRLRVLVRVGIGVMAAVAGLVLLTTADRGLGDVWSSLLAAVVVLAGVGLVLAPWVVRLWRQLRAEQELRIRATERADIAAHLHDSVLQTLALIQRRSHDPTQVGALARAQERELRAWLYGASPAGAAGITTLAAALRSYAAEVEDTHGVPVELVVTGDRTWDEHAAVLAAAVREAMSNAVRHARPPVSAYVEIGEREVAAFVRDHGSGFSLDAVAPDRMGVRESILGRVQRGGGTAQIRFRDPGTEVEVRMPLPDRPGSTARGPESADPHADIRAEPHADTQGEHR